MLALSLSHKSGVILTPTFLTACPLQCKGTHAEPERERWFVYYRLTSLWYHDKMGKNRHKIDTYEKEYNKMGKIKTNLRERMREKGYTRAQFAEMCDINEETLKKYLSKDDYPTRWLKVFADKLDCTYDYLLGKSKVPERKYKDTRNETRLSIESIDNLKKYNDNGVMFETINIILENESVWKALALYMVSDITQPIIEEKTNETLEKYNADNETGFLLNEIPTAKVTTQITLINALDNVKTKYTEKVLIRQLNKKIKKKKCM